MPIVTKTLIARMLACGVLAGAFMPSGAWAEAADPAAPTSRVQLTEELYAGFTTFFPPPDAPTLAGDSVQVGASLSAAVYFRPLVDDSAPRALQPFLQRASTFLLQARGNVLNITSRQGGQWQSASVDKQVGASLAIDAYVRDFFILFGSLGMNSHSLNYSFPGQDLTSYLEIEVLPVTVGAGLRIGDTRIDVAYQFAPASRFAATVLLSGSSVAAGVRTVLKRRVDLSLGGTLNEHGVNATAGLALFASRDFGIFSSVSYTHGRIDDGFINLLPIDRINGRVGVSYWASRTVSGSLSYAPTWTSANTQSLDHIFALTVDSRL